MCLAKTAQQIKKPPGSFDFSPVHIEDKALIQKYTDKYQPESCEYSFANIYCWKEPYNNLWSIYKDRLVVYDGVNQTSFMPLGKKMAPHELAAFSKCMKKRGLGPDIGVVPSEYIENHPEVERYYTVVDERDSAEYIYSVEALCDLKGVKLHKKKNLISQFHRKYPNFSVAPMTDTLISKVKLLADQIYNSHERFLPGIENEHIALMQAFDNFDRIGLEGLVVNIGDDLVAFSVFSALNDDMYDIHFEKSCHQFKGAAQVINHETAKVLREKCRYVNREQDLGIQGLRQAKMSYDPETLYTVHTLVFK